MEPTRHHVKPINIKPAYNGGQKSPRLSGGASGGSGGNTNSGRYRPLSGDEEDAEHLVAHAQPDPYAAGGRPHLADQGRMDSREGDLGTMGGQERFRVGHTGTVGRQGLGDDGPRYEDTGYSGARRL